MATNQFKFYYHQAAWQRAFGSATGNTARIVFDTQGSVYKNQISFGNLVISYLGVVGPAALTQDGQITIWSNAETGLYTGAIHVLLESEFENYQLAGGTIAADQYLHFAITIDNVNLLMKLYINGVLVGQTTFTDPPNLMNKVQKAMMFRYLDLNITDHWYRGKIDDFRIYGQVLTPQDVEDIYDWGRQYLQFQNKIYVPPQQVSRGMSAGFRFSTEDYAQIRTLSVEYIPTNLR